MYICCVVCYGVIADPNVRSVGHVFTYLYTLDDDSEHPMDYETSLFPKVFSYAYCHNVLEEPLMHILNSFAY